jgi:hypothetical protein
MSQDGGIAPRIPAFVLRRPPVAGVSKDDEGHIAGRGFVRTDWRDAQLPPLPCLSRLALPRRTR